MSPTTTPANTFVLQQQRHDRLSVFAVIAVTLVALALGVVVRQAAEGRSRLFLYKGVAAAVPVGWLVEEGVGELAFQARNPAAPSQQYQVSLLQPTGELSQIAAQRALARGRINETFRVLDEGSREINGHNGYQVSYAYVNVRATGLPSIIEGEAYYFVEGGKTVEVTFENRHEDFEATRPQFQRFLRSLNHGTGG